MGIISRLGRGGVEIECEPGSGNSRSNSMECRVTGGLVRDESRKVGWAQIRASKAS